MIKAIARLVVVVLAAGSWSQAFQKNARTAAPATRPGHVLTNEEKEMLKQRELLENLELLQNFEKIKYLGFLAAHGKDKNKGKQSDRPTTKDNEPKNVNP